MFGFLSFAEAAAGFVGIPGFGPLWGLAVDDGGFVGSCSVTLSCGSISSGSAVFSVWKSVTAGPTCADEDAPSLSASGTTSVFTTLFLPNFALSRLLTRRCDPLLATDALEDVAELELLSNLCRIPGCDSSSMTC